MKLEKRKIRAFQLASRAKKGKTKTSGGRRKPPAHKIVNRQKKEYKKGRSRGYVGMARTNRTRVVQQQELARIVQEDTPRKKIRNSWGRED